MSTYHVIVNGIPLCQSSLLDTAIQAKIDGGLPYDYYLSCEHELLETARIARNWLNTLDHSKIVVLSLGSCPLK